MPEISADTNSIYAELDFLPPGPLSGEKGAEATESEIASEASEASDDGYLTPVKVDGYTEFSPAPPPRPV